MLASSGAGAFIIGVLGVTEPHRLPLIRRLPLDSGGMTIAALLLAVVSLFFAIAALHALLRQSGESQWIALDHSAVRGPISIFNKREVRIPLGELRDVKVSKFSGGAGWAELRGAGRSIKIGSASFESEKIFWQFLNDLGRMRSGG